MFSFPYDSWKNRRAIYRFIQDIPLKPTDRSYRLVSKVQENLERFRNTPAIIFWGARDFVFDIDFLDEWRARLPDARVHVFPDAGHYVLEDAYDDILPKLLDFLKKNPVGKEGVRCG